MAGTQAEAPAPPAEAASADAAERGSRQRGTSVAEILAETHGTTMCRKVDVLAVVFCIVCIAVALWVLNAHSELLLDFSRLIVDLGFIGHLVYLLLFIWVGLPFGYNWSALVILVGFSYGWLGLLDVHVGSFVACVSGFLFSKHFCKSCMDGCLNRVRHSRRLYLKAAKHVIEKEKAGFLMLVLLREVPITLGVQNAFLGSWCNISWVRYLSSSIIGLERQTIMLTYGGVLVRQMGSVAAVSASSTGRRDLMVNIGGYVVALIGISAWVRYLIVYTLPRMISEDAAIEVADPGADHPERPEERES